MKKQAVKHGFAHQESREIKEINSTAHFYVHEKSGARLLHVACNDNNKVFCVGFKTVPEDDTGCPHILEHSVLNGSKNFPAKSTFMELIKGSLHTFINAMTAADMTLYPVASTNDKDFLNLARVYLDAVFYPKIYEQPNIFHQEGWHHELKDPGADLAIRGVVYNEMQGAFSSPDSIIMRGSQHAQFPETPYGYESGGDPEAIPSLSYEDFIAFHQKYYHPDNAHIVIYGDMDPDPVMELMDRDYLSQFQQKKKEIKLPLQKPFKETKIMEVEYPCEENKDITGQYHLSLAYTFGKITEPYVADALSMLAEILMQAPSSPLKRKVMESGLAAESSCYPMVNILQPTLAFIFKQVKKEDITALEELVDSELKNLARKGIDKKLIEALLNKREFFLREAQIQNFPKGLYYAWTSYPQWMHGVHPLDALGFEDTLKELRRGLKEPYFENLIKDALLENPHSSRITYVPVPGLLQQKEQELHEQLAETKKKLGKEGVDELVRFNVEFDAWQHEEVKTEDLEKIPVLGLEDIDPQAESYPTDIDKFREFTLLKHPLETNGITYLKAYFDLAHATEEDLPWLSLYAALAGMVDSENFSYSELSNEIDIHTGGISLDLDLKNSYQDPDVILTKFVLSGKAVQAKVEKLLGLASEFAMRPVFSDLARLKTLIREAKAKMESKLLQHGFIVAIYRMYAPFSQIHHFMDLTQGLGYYQFLAGLEKKLEKDVKSVSEELERVRQTFFTKQNLILSLTADESGINAAFQFLKPALYDIPDESPPPAENHFHPTELNEGLLAPIRIQFCAKGGNFFRKGYSYSGKMHVLKNILANEFLYREIREKGGAYGAFSNFSTAGNMYFCSYRDPNLKETLAVFDRVPRYLRDFSCDKREMEKYIIGAISILNQPKTPESQGAQGDEDYITGFSQADRQQIREEVLSTRQADINAYSDMVEAIMSKDHYCVLGNETRIKEARELFHRLTPVFSE